MKYVASVVVDGIEEAGYVTNMLGWNGDEVKSIAEAHAFVIECSRGFITVDADHAPIHTVH